MSSRPQNLANIDFSQQPAVVIWEMTQACDLACVHCRASAQPLRDKFELNTESAERLIDQVAELAPPIFVLSGGDPLKRPDLLHLIRYATERGVRTSITPSATPLLTPDSVAELKAAGIAQMALSLDGATPASHDAFRGVLGSFARTMVAAEAARHCGLPLQINTTICRRTLPEFEALAALVESLHPQMWSVFFLVPTGRALLNDMLDAGQTEDVFARLYELSKRVHFRIKTTEAQHYRRYCLQQWLAEGKRGRPPEYLRINDAKGFVFISHMGFIYPSGFLPIPAGNVRTHALAEIYRGPLFRSLRDSGNLKGKCGRCEFKEICGGSRARSYALSGDIFAEETTCAYQPAPAP